MERSFFTCATTHPFSILSSQGVRSANDVRSLDTTFSAFLKRLPVIPEDVANGASLMISALRSRGMIKDVTFADVLLELRARPLSEAEAIACMKWWITVSKDSKNDMNVLQGRSQLLNNMVITLGDASATNEKIVPLSAIRTFLNPRSTGSIIPTDGPLPENLLPISISRSFDPDSLGTVFSWSQLTIIDWLKHIIDPTVAASNAEYDITLSAVFAERVLTSLGRAWSSCSKPVHEEIKDLLRSKPCIPTSSGMKIPSHAYFSNVNLFRDLPVVQMPSGMAVKGPMEKFLQALEVRKHVELQLVFDRSEQPSIISRF